MQVGFQHKMQSCVTITAVVLRSKQRPSVQGGEITNKGTQQ